MQVLSFNCRRPGGNFNVQLCQADRRLHSFDEEQHRYRNGFFRLQPAAEETLQAMGSAELRHRMRTAPVEPVSDVTSSTIRPISFPR
jgi:hypothetical protein